LCPMIIPHTWPILAGFVSFKKLFQKAKPINY
jgi:hypothetical protein